MSRETSSTPPVSELSPEVQASLAARLGEAAWRRRLAVQRRLEVDPESDEAGPVNVQRFVRSAKFMQRILRAFGVAAWGRRNMLAIRRVENVLRLRGLPPAFHGRRILHLSDLHVDMDAEIVPVVGRALAGWEYDAVVLTGDYRAHTRHEWGRALAACAEITRALKTGAPIFAILGNHDPLEMVPGLESLGWRILLNEAEPWRLDGAELWMAGVDDAHTYKTADVARARAQVPAGACALLLSHTPQLYAVAAAAGFAGCLCGHTHGGQICLPGGLVLLNNARGTPRRLLKGPWEFQNLSGYTSVGAGACRVPARFFCPPEVTRHTLQPGA